MKTVTVSTTALDFKVKLKGDIWFQFVCFHPFIRWFLEIPTPSHRRGSKKTLELGVFPSTGFGKNESRAFSTKHTRHKSGTSSGWKLGQLSMAVSCGLKTKMNKKTEIANILMTHLQKASHYLEAHCCVTGLIYSSGHFCQVYINNHLANVFPKRTETAAQSSQMIW